MRFTCSYYHTLQLQRHSRWWLMQQWIWAFTSHKLSLICFSAGRTPPIASSKSLCASQDLEREPLLVEQPLWSCEVLLLHLVSPLKLGPCAWAAQQAGCCFINAWVRKIPGLTDSTPPNQRVWQCPRVFYASSWEICMQVRKQQLELDMEQQAGFK